MRDEEQMVLDYLGEAQKCAEMSRYDDFEIRVRRAIMAFNLSPYKDAVIACVNNGLTTEKSVN